MVSGAWIFGSDAYLFPADYLFNVIHYYIWELIHRVQIHTRTRLKYAPELPVFDEDLNLHTSI